MYFLQPTKAEVDRYFDKNNCISSNMCVYYIRRDSGRLFGQVFNVPDLFTPKFVLYTTTPFHYYRDIELVTIDDGDETSYRYTWVDTRDGRLVYDAVTGKYIKKISSNIDPDKAYNEEMDKYVKKMRNLQENAVCSSNTYNCEDFDTKAKAQAVYYQCKQEVGSDIHLLDMDDDGLACESLP